MKNLKTLIVTALFAAITCALTFTVKFPTAVGYVHPGDSVIYLAACVLPFPHSLIAAAIGGALADLISGYPQWILPTLLIKAAVTLPFSAKSVKTLTLRNFIMVFPAGLITVAGYFVAAWIMYDWAAAVVEIPGSFTQAAINAVIFVIITAALDKIKFKEMILK